MKSMHHLNVNFHSQRPKNNLRTGPDVIFRKFFHRWAYHMAKRGAAAYGNKPLGTDSNQMHFTQLLLEEVIIEVVCLYEECRQQIRCY